MRQRPLRLLLIIGIALSVFSGCSRRTEAERNAALSPPTRSEIWAAIEAQTGRYRLDPAFVYALVAAESNFNPAARQGDACGLLQIKPIAWKTVSTLPYEPKVWEWRANLEVGIDYLAYSRAYLHRKNVFSYPLLLAAFHYGLEYVEERHFDLRRVPIPNNAIYAQLWAGNLSPVPPPSGETSAQAGQKKPAAEAAGK